MSVVIWQDKVKIVTGEISRAGFFTLAREIDQANEQIKDGGVDGMRMMNDFAVIKATRAVYIANHDGWFEVTGESEFEHQDAIYKISQPVTSEMLDQLPASLALRWTEAAQKDNAELLSGVFFGSGRAKKQKK